MRDVRQNASMDRTRLARTLVQAALRFYDKGLWRKHPSEHIVGLRVPEDPLPLLASIIGSPGQEFGLCLYRGPDALMTLRSMLNDGNREEVIAGWHMLSLTIEPANQVAPGLEELLREARFSGPMAPVFMAKEPGKRSRPMRRAEHELMLRVLSGMLQAEGQGLLRPGSIAPSGPAAIWTLTVEGRPDKPDVRAKYENYAGADPIPHAGPVLLPADLKDLPRTKRSWLVAVPALPAVIADDDRQLRAVVVFDRHKRRIVDLTATLAIDPSAIATLLFDLCRGKRKQKRGLPARIDTDVAAIHQALSPALSALGVACDHVATPIELNAVIAALGAAMDSGDAGAHEDARDTNPDDDDLDAWKDVDAQVTELSVLIAKREGLLKRNVIKPFLGNKVDPFASSDLTFHTAIEWLVFYRRDERYKRTLAEKILQQAEWPTPLRTILAARNKAVLSLYRVADLERGATIDLCDILTGDTFRVHDRSLSETTEVGGTMFMRVYRAGAFFFASAFSCALDPREDHACAWLEAQGLELTHEGLSRAPHLIGRLWEWIAEQQRAPISLVNSDGEVLAAIAVSYGVDDQAAARTAILSRPDVEDDEAGHLIWFAARGESQVLHARMEFIGDELVAEVNSEERLARLRRWLSLIPGVNERSVTHRDPREVTPDDALRSTEAEAEPDLAGADAAELMRPMLHSRYMGWLDESIPALGGQTPRQACRTKDGRRRVARLIRSYPDPHGPSGVMRGLVPRDEMLRELGLEAES